MHPAARHIVIAHANALATIDGVAPTKRFEESIDLTVGGKTFELTYLGKGHGANLIAVVVRLENVAFIVDVTAPKRMPYRDLPGSDVDAWIDQIRKVEVCNLIFSHPVMAPLAARPMQ
jgi:hypothetical protein